MSKDEAFALFERIYRTYSAMLIEIEIKLIWTKDGGLRPFPVQEWMIVVGDEVLESEEDWNDYKRMHTILETDQDVEDYADAMRTQAEIEWEEAE